MMKNPDATVNPRSSLSALRSLILMHKPLLLSISVMSSTLSWTSKPGFGGARSKDNGNATGKPKEKALLRGLSCS